MVNIGEKVADFSVPATGDKSLSLSDFKDKNLVVYFYPKDNTPGCTKEACGFRDSHARIKRTGTVVLGASRDSLRSHDGFVAKHELNFPLLSDDKGKITEAYGVWKEKNMYGRKVMGVERSTFLIDGAGVLRAEWRKVRVPGHVAEVLEAVRGLD